MFVIIRSPSSMFEDLQFVIWIGLTRTIYPAHSWALVLLAATIFFSVIVIVNRIIVTGIINMVSVDSNSKLDNWEVWLSSLERYYWNLITHLVVKAKGRNFARLCIHLLRRFGPDLNYSPCSHRKSLHLLY
jgi:hypothetical protein